MRRTPEKSLPVNSPRRISLSRTWGSTRKTRTWQAADRTPARAAIGRASLGRERRSAPANPRAPKYAYRTMTAEGAASVRYLSSPCSITRKGRNAAASRQIAATYRQRAFPPAVRKYSTRPQDTTRKKAQPMIRSADSSTSGGSVSGRNGQEGEGSAKFAARWKTRRKNHSICPGRSDTRAIRSRCPG